MPNLPSACLLVGGSRYTATAVPLRIVTRLSDVGLIGLTQQLHEGMATASQVSATSSKEEIVVAYLRKQVRTGDQYFKSRFIASDIELSPKEIGAVMRKLRNQSDRLEVEKWSYTNGTTWRVTVDEGTG